MAQMTHTRWWRRVLRYTAHGKSGLTTEQKGRALFLSMCAAQNAYNAWADAQDADAVEAVMDAVNDAVSNAICQPVESRQDPYAFAAGVIFNGGSAEDDTDDEDADDEDTDDED